ncbi:Zeta toxin domain-containing protein (plasmid) [Paraburkholderia kururiensis]|uniref:KfrB domain-containing protein n=1 Tax=Paraburkholderia kururiensis TaxID=984307 RepID=UPI0039A5388B
MELENIRYVNFDEPDRRRVQDRAIESARAAPEKYIEAYRSDARSFEGRYVAADLFKETFPEFSASREARNRYNQPVHNTAAVLSSALFAENLRAPREPGRDTVYFLTGSPGAGKTSLMLKENRLPPDAVMVFEGQMSSFETSRDKVQKVLDAGYRAHIMVVHPSVEDALDKTLQRFYEEGRGSSIGTIARIVGGLPDSLSQLGAYFGSNLLLDIIDVRDRSNPVNLQGFGNVNVLRSEGNHEHIQQRLHARIDQQREAGRIDDAAYRQAAGFPPRDSLAMDSQRHERSQGDARERGSAAGRSGQAVLNAAADKAPGAQASAAAHLRVTKANELETNVVVRGKVLSVTEERVLVQTGRTDAVEFARSDVSGAVRVGQKVQLNFQENGHRQAVGREQEKTAAKQEQTRNVSDT